MYRKGEKLLQRRHRFFDMAPTEAIRAKLSSIARLNEIEARLIDRAHQCIVDSKEIGH